ncbi:AtzE family amidohydrolase [Sphingomonas sp. AP4-R1]|uniref:AtzE family amidohydrolase n=1 Tax=Sphingomonas sp. AP4-R1 TaxID=2735134 RepID=UPI0014936DE0|nr:AtzE family amidohydrolase [Sphingomonas sp. AP4-R1]QJU56804.1 AtzE family amidohydrolase [Sphingomonas sp. AP4-R1]
MSRPAASIAAIAADVRAGKRKAVDIAREALDRLRADPCVAVTRILSERALAEAEAVDATVAGGGDPGPLAGVPYGVKDLFDVAGLPTTAGNAARLEAEPATRDAEAIHRLHAAGAVLTATLNMDEFAYGFATINAHFGTTRNPHDPARLAGGSSGGSAAVVAGGLLPLALGSDTNGSIRIPAALCGVYGLKPTHEALPLEGVYPFVDSFDDIGPFAADIEGLRLATETLRGAPLQAAMPRSIALLGGWFASNLSPDMIAARARIAAHLGAGEAELPAVDVARSSAFLITASEGGRFHAPMLADRALTYDPATRDRLIAGATLSSAIVADARRFRRWFAAQADALFAEWDVLIAPATPCAAPPIADPMIAVGGQRVPARAHLGIHTQPLSFIGLPSLVVPLRDCGALPLGLQLVGPPGGEARLFALAARLEADGLVGGWPACGA